MSRNSDAKKARRRKRQVGRAVRQARAEFDRELAGVAEAVAEVNSWLVGRGWLLDEDTSDDDLLNWVYPPSAAEVDDDREPVTRIWMTLTEDDEQYVFEMGAVLAGAGNGDGAGAGAYLLDPETLPAQIGVVEDYRVGLPRPELD